MKRAITTTIIVILLSSTANAKTVYISRYYLGRPEMAEAIEMLESSGYIISTDRKSSKLELRIRYSYNSKQLYGRFDGIRGGYQQRQYVAAATLINRETGILVSNGTGVASYSLDARVPVSVRTRSYRFGGFSGFSIGGRSVNFGGRNARDEAKERATNRAVEELILKAQDKQRKPECPAGKRVIYGVVID